MVQEAKKAIVEKLTELVKDAKSSTMTDFSGLKVAELDDLRNQLREVGGEYRVIKNRLFKLALGPLGLDEDPSSYLTGPTGVVIAHEDPFRPAKVIVDFSKKSKHLTIKGAIIGNRVLTEEQLQAVAKIPSQEVLLGLVVGAVQAPLSGFVCTLSGVLSKFVNVLREIADKKEQDPASA